MWTLPEKDLLQIFFYWIKFGVVNITFNIYILELFNTCLFFWHLYSICLVAEKSPIYSLKGQQVGLKPSFTGEADEILWKHNGNKAIEFTGSEELVYGTFKNRVTLDWHSAQLNITDLRFEDSGDYDLEVVIKQMLYEYNYKLEVIGKFLLTFTFSFSTFWKDKTELSEYKFKATPQHQRNKLQQA